MKEPAARASKLLVTEIDVQRLEQERRRLQNADSGWSEDYEMVDFHWTVEETVLTRSVAPMPFVPADLQQRWETCDEILTVAALGLKRRMEHTWAKTAVIGLSGGLDSTLALLIVIRAFDMLGRDHKDILAVTMPCFGTTDRTRSNAEILAECAPYAEWCEDPVEAMKDADYVYTDVWVSMGFEEERARRMEILKPYQVNKKLVANASKNVKFLHCLPAHRGEEVSEDVMDSDMSIVFDEAENRLHVQKAV